MKQRRFTGIIEAEKQDLGLFLPEPKRCKNPIKPIKQKHGFVLLLLIYNESIKKIEFWLKYNESLR